MGSRGKGPAAIEEKKEEKPKQAPVLFVDQATGRGKMHAFNPAKAQELEEKRKSYYGESSIGNYIKAVFKGGNEPGEKAVRPHVCEECGDVGTLTVWLDRTLGTYPYAFRCKCEAGCNLADTIMHYTQAKQYGYVALRDYQKNKEEQQDFNHRFREVTP